MFAYSGKLLALAGQTREAVVDAGVGSGEVAGSLTVSAPETLLTYRLPKLLALFHERHPKVRLSVRPSAIGRLVGSARKAVEEDAVDVAFVLDEPLNERMHPTDLAVETLVAEEVTVIAPASHALASASAVLPQDLRGETVLLPEAPESGCAYRGQFERQLGSAGVVPPGDDGVPEHRGRQTVRCGRHGRLCAAKRRCEYRAEGEHADRAAVG